MEIEIISKNKHTIHGLNFYLSYFDDIAKLLSREDYCFVVGGWVRDRILGEPVGYNIDVDLLTTAEPESLARAFADRIGGSFFVFEKRGLLIKRPVIASVVLHLPPYRYRFDFSQVKGKDLEKALIEDLKERDFTANAIAVNLDDVLSIGAKQTILLDPTGGIRDLERGLLRPVSLENLKRDPVRILRGFRIAVERKLELTPEFYSFVEENKSLVLKSSPERITYELFKIMKAKGSAQTVRRLYELGILEVILPEVAKLRQIRDQGEHHIYPLDEHSLRTLEAVERVIEDRERYLPPELCREIGKRSFLGEFSDVEALKWAALLHDIGKPDTFEIRDGKVTFYGHDKLGREILRGIAKRLRWGRELESFIGRLVEAHLRPFFLKESLRKGELTRRGMAKFWRELGDLAPHLLLLSLADAFASGDKEEEIELLLKTWHELESLKRDFYDRKPKEALLNGREIMNLLGLQEGRLVGELKEALMRAQDEGKVRTKEEAVEFLREEFSKRS